MGTGDANPLAGRRLEYHSAERRRRLRPDDGTSDRGIQQSIHHAGGKPGGHAFVDDGEQSFRGDKLQCEYALRRQRAGVYDQCQRRGTKHKSDRDLHSAGERPAQQPDHLPCLSDDRRTDFAQFESADTGLLGDARRQFRESELNSGDDRYQRSVALNLHGQRVHHGRGDMDPAQQHQRHDQHHQPRL